MNSADIGLNTVYLAVSLASYLSWLNCSLKAGQNAVSLSVCLCVCVWMLTRLAQVVTAAHKDL